MFGVVSVKKMRFRMNKLGDRKKKAGTKRRTITNKQCSILLTPVQI
jgi:hypothetical protein